MRGLVRGDQLRSSQQSESLYVWSDLWWPRGTRVFMFLCTRNDYQGVIIQQTQSFRLGFFVGIHSPPSYHHPATTTQLPPQLSPQLSPPNYHYHQILSYMIRSPPSACCSGHSCNECLQAGSLMITATPKGAYTTFRLCSRENEGSEWRMCDILQ